MNVLVTTGTAADYQFERLMRIIDELCEEKILMPQTLIVQSTDKYSAKNFVPKRMMPQHEFDEVIKNSDVIITHAGTGTVTRTLKYGKKVIMFPRRVMYNEHMDDHQLDLCELFSSMNYALVANDKDELIKAIKEIEKFHPNEFISRNEKINQLIKEFIDKQ